MQGCAAICTLDFKAASRLQQTLHSFQTLSVAKDPLSQLAEPQNNKYDDDSSSKHSNHSKRSK